MGRWLLCWLHNSNWYISNILLFEQSIHLLHIFQNLINVVFILIFMQSPFLRNTNILPSVCFYASHSIIFTYYLPINKSRQWPMSKTGLHSIMQISSQSQPFATQIISSKMSPLSYIQTSCGVVDFLEDIQRTQVSLMKLPARLLHPDRRTRKARILENWMY